jgi:hypothetical protein
VSSIEERLDRIEAMLKILIASKEPGGDVAVAEFQLLLDLKKGLPPDEYELEHGRVMAQRLIRAGNPLGAAKMLKASQRKAARLRGSL